MRRINQFRKIEKELRQKHGGCCANTVVMNDDDFKNGQLTAGGYCRLKQDCEYIRYSDDIEIIVPTQREEAFKYCLENMAAAELCQIRTDRREMMFASFLILATGILWFTLSQIFSDQRVLHEILMVATWCFTWTALAKWFFDRAKLRNRKYSLLHILTAKIIPQ
jgi:hypothetical protein